jgi:hypothetical protein
MQTIRELGSYLWNRPWSSAVVYATDRLYLGFTYAAITAAIAAFHWVIENSGFENSGVKN